MDIVIAGIHYIELESHIPEHIKKCNSHEFVMQVCWMVANEIHTNSTSLDVAIDVALDAIYKIKYN
jgi:hypothetical protein